MTQQGTQASKSQGQPKTSPKAPNLTPIRAKWARYDETRIILIVI
jgi:hypothetical protein